MTAPSPHDRLLELTRHLESHVEGLRESGVTHLPVAGMPPRTTPAGPGKDVQASNPTPAAPAREESTVWMQPARRRPGLDPSTPATILVISDPASRGTEALEMLDRMLAAIGFLRTGEAQPWSVESAKAESPRALLAMGDDALRAITGRDSWSVSLTGGTWNSAHELDLMATYSAATLLQSQQYKRQAWKDLQAVLKRLDLPLPD